MTSLSAFTDSTGYYRFIYEITYSATEQFYIGKHTTKNIDDGYMGSGVALRQMYKQLGGTKGFSRRIIVFTDSDYELNRLERKFIAEAKTKPGCLNRAAGGSGGWEYVNSDKVMSFERRSASQKRRFENPIEREKCSQRQKIVCQNLTQAEREAISEKLSVALKKFVKDHPDHYKNTAQNPHFWTDSMRAKLSAANRGKVAVNKGMVVYVNRLTGKKQYFNKNAQIPEDFITAKEYNKLIGKKTKTQVKREKRHDEFVRRREEHIRETQEMADYFTKYGYEATCRKFPGRTGTCSIEAMLMRFIKARKKYGIRFESRRTVGGRRTFETPPEES